MSKSTTVFAKWDLISEQVIRNYNEKLSLPCDFKTHFNEQFRVLKSLHLQDPWKKESLDSMAIKRLKTNKILDNGFKEKILDEIRNKSNLDDNQFITVGKAGKKNFVWMDDRLASVLKIPKKNFTVSGLFGIDKKLNLYHPLDVNHYLRYRNLAFFINALKGMDFTTLKDYYSVKFRLGVDLNKPVKDVNSRTRMVQQKCYGLMNENEFNNHKGQKSDPLYHLDVWTITDYHEQQRHVSTDFEVIGDPTKTKFINLLFYMANAKLLNFQPKELLVLSYLNKYDTTEESRSRLNRQIRLKSINNCEFENKAFTDFSYLLNRKLTKVVINNSLDSENNSQFFNSMNRLTKARMLGLIPLPSELEDIFLASGCRN